MADDMHQAVAEQQGAVPDAAAQREVIAPSLVTVPTSRSGSTRTRRSSVSRSAGKPRSANRRTKDDRAWTDLSVIT